MYVGKMKLRIKAKCLQSPILVHFESTSVSVFQLKTKLADIFHLENAELINSLQISFNGKDVVESEPADCLSSLGFVSGDAIHILGISQDHQIKETKTPNQLKSVPEKKFNNIQNDKTLSNPSQPIPEKRMCDTVINKFLPTAPISENQNSAAPPSFSTLLSANPDKFESVFEKFCGLLHLLTVETGFTPSTRIETSNPSYLVLPDSWKIQNETLKLNYHSPYPPFSQCTIVMTAVGSVVMVYGLVPSQKPLTLKLKPGDYISADRYKNLKKLSLLFKNEVSYPLLVTIQREVNGPCPYNLCNLPPEISYRILHLLDVQSLCRLSQVSRQFQQLANQPLIWKKLVLRNFGKHVGPAADVNHWKNTYKSKYIIDQKQKRGTFSSPRYMQPTFPTAPRLPYGQFLPDNSIPPPFPGIIGGENDLFPDLGGIGPPSRRLPFNRGTNPRNLFSPFRDGFSHF